MIRGFIKYKSCLFPFSVIPFSINFKANCFYDDFMRWYKECHKNEKVFIEPYNVIKIYIPLFVCGKILTK